VADLEAELDDPYTHGEWEEVETTHSDVRPETVESTKTARESHQRQNTSEDTNTNVQLATATEDSEQDHCGPSDGEIVEASDDSGGDQRIHQAAEALGYLNIEEPAVSSSTANSKPQQISNATVAPVDIIGKKAVSSGTSSRLEQPASRAERDATRTPSPNGLTSSLTDAVTGPDGPMTPRNDAGPFVFDGSAGGTSETRLESLTSGNLNDSEDNPSQSTPHATS